ncbi:MAG: hypothetical protein ACRC0R_04655 [Cetobacterium sp.]
MKKVYFAMFFVLNFLGAFATSTVDVSTTLKLVDSIKMNNSSTFANNKNAGFSITKLSSDEVKVSIKEVKEGKVQLTNLAGEKVLVDLKSNTEYKKTNIEGNLLLGKANSDLKGKVTLRVMYN